MSPKPDYNYSCFMPGTRKTSLTTVPFATPLPNLPLENSLSIVRSIIGFEEDTAHRVAKIAIKSYENIPIPSSFVNSYGMLEFYALKDAINTAIHSVPEPLRFVVSAPDYAPSEDRAESISLLFSSEHFWPHVSQFSTSESNPCLSIPLVRSIMQILYPENLYSPHCFYGPLGFITPTFNPILCPRIIFVTEAPC